MTAAETVTDRETLSPAALVPLLEAAAEAAGTLNVQATEAVKAKLAPGGKIDNAALEREQHVAHGLAWISTYAEGIRQLADYAKRYGAGERWLFLTGEKEPLYWLIMDGFKLGVDDGSALTAGVPGPGTITHSTRFVLVDREGRIRAYYDGSSEDIAEQLLPDIRALLRE